MRNDTITVVKIDLLGLLDYGSGLVFFLTYYLLVEYGFEGSFWTYRHGLQIATAEANLKLERLVAHAGYSGTTV